MNWLKLVASLAVCQGAGLAGSVFNIESIPTWYATINKPFFNPPNWVFAPVWTILFILMGVSLYLVWENGFGKEEVKKSVYLFGIQLALNIFWSALFFGLRSPGLAFVEIVLLWAAILLTIMQFKKVSKKAAWLLVPYIAWVSFAALLNLSVWGLNP
ncbi:MAG: tryptophan-rich sensory protein [Candidatus Altiarchaeota archaeon]|nr:tryptophan-rich sensory protein [Candidatus Altiarchaeota archaeon]